MKTRIFLLLSCSVLAACSERGESEIPVVTSIDTMARDYLFLELSMGWHDNAHVDAYFGPEEIQTAANEAQLSLNDIHNRTVALSQKLSTALSSETDDTRSSRIEGLLARLRALETRIALNQRTDNFL
jgi:hypothetical protein